MKRRLVTVSAVALIAVLVGAPAAANAGTIESGLWYFDRGHVQDAFDAGFTGEGVAVAVIDGSINPDAPGLRGANLEVVEPSFCFDEAGEPLPAVSTEYAIAGHGTNVASLIAGTGETTTSPVGVKGVAPGADVRFYSAFVSAAADDADACPQENGEAFGPNGTGIGNAIAAAVDDGADIISVSLSVSLDINEEIAKALAADVVVVASLPNVGGVALRPASANGVVAVQAFDAEGNIQSSSLLEGLDPTPNTSSDVIVAAPGMGILVQGYTTSWDEQMLGDGTSYATPIAAGFLAVVKSKYPDATANQLIQSLIHNTGGNVDHEPQWGNDKGYGAISLTAMLQVDPAKYPDVNPIFDMDDPQARPSAADVEAAATAATSESTPEPTSAPAASDAATPAWLPWAVGGGIVGVLVVAGVIVLAVVLSRSSRRADEKQGGNQ
ncbi:S8 family peptidase [Microbacterium sp.]|uniref:S8 family peptidase n=1 Tax=Microbacterium sp. TaxID=51671 RepID=UPI003F9E0292